MLRLLRVAVLLLLLVAVTPASGSVEEDEDEIFFGDQAVDEQAAPQPAAKPAHKPHARAAAKASIANEEEEEEFNRRLGNQAAGSPSKLPTTMPTDPASATGTPTPTSSERRERPATPAELARAARERAALARPRLTLSSYSWEICALGFFLAYGIVYLYGRRSNDRVATGWALALEELLGTQFAQVGDEADGSGPLSKHSPTTYTIYATGRDHCEWMQATLQLQARQDLYQLIGSSIFAPEPDRLVLDVGFAEEEAPDAYVLALLDRRADKSYAADLKARAVRIHYSDLKGIGLPDGTRVLAELKELPALLLTKDVQAALVHNATRFESLHITDMPDAEWMVPGGAARFARFVFRLPNESSQRTVGAARESALLIATELLRLALLVTDRVAKMRLPPTVRERMKEVRAREESLRYRAGHAKRQELAQQRKSEKLAELKNRAPLASREAQKKREEKEARQAAKARGPKARILKM